MEKFANLKIGTLNYKIENEVEHFLLLFDKEDLYKTNLVIEDSDDIVLKEIGFKNIAVECRKHLVSNGFNKSYLSELYNEFRSELYEGIESDIEDEKYIQELSKEYKSYSPKYEISVLLEFLSLCFVDEKEEVTYHNKNFYGLKKEDFSDLDTLQSIIFKKYETLPHEVLLVLRLFSNHYVNKYHSVILLMLISILVMIIDDEEVVQLDLSQYIENEDEFDELIDKL